LATSTERTLGARLALAALAVLPFAPSLAHPFFADDFIHLERARSLGGPPWPGLAEAWVLRAADSAAWWSPPDLAIAYFRPLVALSFVADHALWGLAPWGFHLTNLLLHAATTLVVYAIALRLLASGAAAFSAAALFALHPCHAEAVLWVSGRTDLLAGLASAAAFLLYVHSQQDEARARAFLLTSCVALALALAAKEVAVCVPLLMLLYAVVAPGSAPLWRRAQGPLLAAAVVGAYVLARSAVLGGSAVPPHPFAHRPGDPDFLAHALMAPVLYLADLVLFVPPDPVVTLPWWRAHPLAFGTLAVLSTLTLISSLRRVREGWLRSFVLGWVAVALLPAALASVGERFLYLPSIGYCLLVGAGAGVLLQRDPLRARRVMLATGAVVAAVAVTRSAAFGVMAGRSQQVVDDAVAALRAAPDRSLILVVDLPAGAALGFAHALRLERTAPLQVEVLSLTPGFFPRDGTPASTVRLMPGGLVLSRPVPYLRNYIERAYLGERAPLVPGDMMVRSGLSVLVREAAAGGVGSFEVRLRPEALPRSLLLRGHGLRLQADPAWLP
jgi:hypothetical protein